MSRQASQGSRQRWWLGLRRDVILALAILGALSLAAERLNRPEGFSQAGSVSIHDGDTLTLKGERIRLLDIDAPELRQVCRRGGKSYSCGEVSRDALIELVGRYPVSCAATKRDRYRRLLGTCEANGVDLNLAQVRSGWAVAYGKVLKGEEEDARRRKAGMWAGTFDNPKAWRQRHGDAGDLEFGFLAELAVRLGEALGLVSAPAWQKEGDAALLLGVSEAP